MAHHGGHGQEIIRVSSHSLSLVKRIAEGGFGLVELVVDNFKGTELILKRCGLQRQEDFSTANKEIKLLTTFASPYVVKLIASEIQTLRSGGQEAMILLEYCPGGHLLQRINDQRGHKFPLAEIYRIFGQLLLSLQPLHDHSPPCAHRDLKLENILFAADQNIRLCDFGSCSMGYTSLVSVADKAAAEEVLAKTTTPNYRAPEMIDLYMRDELTEKTDIWALGCIFYAICFLSHPFQDCGGLGILNAKITIPKSSPIPPEAETLLMRMLDFDPEARPSIREIFPYLRALAKGGTVPELPLSDEAVAQKQRRKEAELRREQKALKKVKTPIVPVRAPQASHLDPGSVAAKRLAMKKGLPVYEGLAPAADTSFNVDFDSVPIPQAETFAAFSEPLSTASFDPFATSALSVDSFNSAAAVSQNVFGSVSFDSVGFDAFSSPQMATSKIPPSSDFGSFDAPALDPFLQPTGATGFDAFSPNTEQSGNQSSLVTSFDAFDSSTPPSINVSRPQQLEQSSEVDVMDLFDTGISGIKSSWTYAPPLASTSASSRNNSVTEAPVDILDVSDCGSSSTGKTLDLLDMDSDTKEKSSQKTWDMLSDLIDALPNTVEKTCPQPTSKIDVMKLFDSNKQGTTSLQQNAAFLNNSRQPMTVPGSGCMSFQSQPPPPPPLHVVMAGRSLTAGLKTTKTIDPFESLKMNAASPQGKK